MIKQEDIFTIVRDALRQEQTHELPDISITGKEIECITRQILGTISTIFAQMSHVDMALIDLEDRIRKILIGSDNIESSRVIDTIIASLSDILKEQNTDTPPWDLLEEQKNPQILDTMLAHIQKKDIQFTPDKDSTALPHFLDTTIQNCAQLTPIQEKIISYHILTRSQDDPLYMMALDILVSSNIRIVLLCLSKEGIVTSDSRFQELFSCGLENLAIAARSFDARKGKFYGHALDWIAQGIHREKTKFHTIHIPYLRYRDAIEFRKKLKEYFGKYGPYSTKELQEFCEKNNMKLATVQRLISVQTPEIIRLDAKPRTQITFLENALTNFLDYEGNNSNKENDRKMIELLLTHCFGGKKSLKQIAKGKRNIDIIIDIYGLTSGEKMTIPAVASKNSMTETAVKHILYQDFPGKARTLIERIKTCLENRGEEIDQTSIIDFLERELQGEQKESITINWYNHNNNS